MTIDYLMLVLFTIFGALGSFFFKLSANNSEDLKHLLKNFYTYVGIIFYIISSILNIIVLLALPYTVVLPCSSITYIWSLYLSKTLLSEKVGPLKMAGIAFILLGTIVIAVT